MDYQAKNISKDGVLQIPADGYAFKKIEEIWPNFKVKPCSLRLSLAADNVNPFGELRSIYSVWHVFIINNNLHPWMSIKREHIMLAIIVSGICLEYFF